MDMGLAELGMGVWGDDGEMDLDGPFRPEAPRPDDARSREIDHVLGLARVLAQELTGLCNAGREGHSLRIARALSLDVVDLLQDARAEPQAS